MTSPDAILALRDRVVAALGAQYELGAELGRGGMSIVYEALDVRLQRPVAIKVLPPDLAYRRDVRERFVREAQMGARLNHPHIVPIYAVHEQPDLVCFAMALVRGESLGAVLVRTPRPELTFVARVLEQMADGLAYAHAAGVVHRDIKPDNVLLDRETGRVQLMDFGIARAAETTTRLTATGVAVGTPAFMSPEQAEGTREIDGRSDVYGVGVVGYLMVAGRLPFMADSTPALLLQHLRDPLPPLHIVAPEIPHALASIVERCLAKRPEDRWPSALALRDALRLWQREATHASASRAGVASAAPVGVDPTAMAPRFGGRSEDWSPRPVGARHAEGAVASPAEQRVVAYPAAASLPAPVSVRGPDVPVQPLMQGLRRHARVLLIAVYAALICLVIGAFAELGFMVIPMVIALLVGMAYLQLVTVDLVRLRRAGVPVTASLRALVAGKGGTLPPGTASASDRYALLITPSVRASRVGPTVQQALTDRLAIDEVLGRLSPADRALVPDVATTAEALLERIAGLATALERLERDVDGDDASTVQARIAAVEAEASSTPERERRLTLLRRQQEAMQDLASRRETMERQLEHAALTLRSLRLDVARLGAMGIEAMRRDLAGTTQEAQAVSRDIGMVIDSVREAAGSAPH
ncbi:MAG: hypothetical protein RLZZ621_1517 [Gemmatimonadota bacterium]